MRTINTDTQEIIRRTTEHPQLAHQVFHLHILLQHEFCSEVKAIISMDSLAASPRPIALLLLVMRR
jgi:hypothetical protein